MIDELDWVRSERPQVEGSTPQARRRARRALDDAIATHGSRRAPRRVTSWLSPGNLAAAGALLVVVAVVAIFLGGHTSKPTRPLSTGGPTLAFQAQPGAETGRVPRPAVRQAASLLQALISSSVGRASVESSGDQVVVALPRGTSSSQLPGVLSLAAVTGRLAFYDWEATALTSKAQSVATRLTAQDPAALAISQGSGSVAPGSPGAGSLPLYAAVKLAARQVGQPRSSRLGRLGPEYFAFGAPGSEACRLAARAYRVTPIAGEPCPLAAEPADNPNDLASALPAGVSLGMNGVETDVVPQGWTVLQAVPTAGFSHALPWSNPSAQYFVLRDRVSVFGNDITDPQQASDPSGQPDVEFRFTAKGANAFQSVTAQVARRGELISSVGMTLNQHFAVTLGTQLITVPSIDFRAYPDGVSGRNGADITGGFTRRSSQTALLEVRLGALPITLKLLSAG
jgi:SecD/SecF fusion protein